MGNRPRLAGLTVLLGLLLPVAAAPTADLDELVQGLESRDAAITSLRGVARQVTAISEQCRAASQREFAELGIVRAQGERDLRLARFEIDLEHERSRFDAVELEDSGVIDTSWSINSAPIRRWVGGVPDNLDTPMVPSRHILPSAVTVRDGPITMQHMLHFGSAAVTGPDSIFHYNTAETYVLRWLGLTIERSSADQFVRGRATAPEGESRVTFESLDGELAERFEWFAKTPHGLLRDRIWVLPQQGWAVARFETFHASTEAPYAGYRRVWSFDKLDELAPGIWLPRRLVRQDYHYVQGQADNWNFTEVIDFESLAVNEPPDETLLSYVLPLGTTVADFVRPGERAMWLPHYRETDPVTEGRRLPKSLPEPDSADRAALPPFERIGNQP